MYFHAAELLASGHVAPTLERANVNSTAYKAQKLRDYAPVVRPLKALR